LFQLASIDTTASHTSAWYMANAYQPGDAVFPTSPVPSGCTTDWNPLSNATNAIPSYDKYGYSLNHNGNGYKVSAFVGNPNGATSIYDSSKGDFATTSPTSAYNWGLAAWDEVDWVAEAIRSDSNYSSRTGDSSGPIPITIYTIGYTGSGGTDYGLLQKIANVQGCKVNGLSCYNNNQPAGLYVQASDKTALANAFSAIATAILRLAR
jgi:hypothetical protein